MRFGRNGCTAVLQHYEAWKKIHVERSGKKRKEERWQIEYARAAERIWFQRHDALHLELQDIWETRIANKHPVRGCLRKVVSMVRMSPSGIRLRRKKEWFCEARRHAAKFMRSTALVESADKREVGDRSELVLFSTPEDSQEIYQVLERHYEDASKLFTNNRTKDQAGILVAHIRQRGYYPIRTTQAFQWLSSRKKNNNKRKFRTPENPQSVIKTKARKQVRSRKRKRSSGTGSRPVQKHSPRKVGKKQQLPASGRKKERSVLAMRPATGQQNSPAERTVANTTKPRKNAQTKSRKDENESKDFETDFEQEFEQVFEEKKIKPITTPCSDRSPVLAEDAMLSMNSTNCDDLDKDVNPQPSFVMSILNSEDSLVSDMMQSFDHQSEWLPVDSTQPLAEGLDLLLELDLSNLPGLSQQPSCIDTPRTPPPSERRYSEDSCDDMLFCPWDSESVSEVRDEDDCDSDRKFFLPSMK